jgi:hypothetical protein
MARGNAWPPPEAELFFADEDLRPCQPEEAYLWTWSGAAGWLRAACTPVPALKKRRAAAGGPRPNLFEPSRG